MRLLSVNRTAAAGARPSSAAACPRLASRTAGPAKRNVVRRFKEEIKGKETAPPEAKRDVAKELESTMAEAMGQMAAAPAPTEEAALPNVVPVLFRVAKRHVPFGQQFAVVGSVKELGEWDATKAVKLEWHEGDDWLATVDLPAGCSLEYKFIRTDDANELLAWESESNMKLKIPSIEEAAAIRQEVVHRGKPAPPEAQAEMPKGEEERAGVSMRDIGAGAEEGMRGAQMETREGEAPVTEEKGMFEASAEAPRETEERAKEPAMAGGEQREFARAGGPMGGEERLTEEEVGEQEPSRFETEARGEEEEEPYEERRAREEREGLEGIQGEGREGGPQAVREDQSLGGFEAGGEAREGGERAEEAQEGIRGATGMVKEEKEKERFAEREGGPQAFGGEAGGEQTGQEEFRGEEQRPSEAVEERREAYPEEGEGAEGQRFESYGREGGPQEAREAGGEEERDFETERVEEERPGGAEEYPEEEGRSEGEGRREGRGEGFLDQAKKRFGLGRE